MIENRLDSKIAKYKKKKWYCGVDKEKNCRLITELHHHLDLVGQAYHGMNVNTKRPIKMPWHFSDWRRWIIDPNALWLSDHSMSTLTLYHTDDECVLNNLPEVLLESCDVLEVWISVFTHFIRTPCLSEPIVHPAGAVRRYGRSSEPVSLLSLAVTPAFYACLSLHVTYF